MSEEERLIIHFLKLGIELNISEVKLKKEDIITIINLIDKLQKGNKQLEQEVEEYNKRGQMLSNMVTQKGSKMYKLICKDFIPKSIVLDTKNNIRQEYLQLIEKTKNVEEKIKLFTEYQSKIILLDSLFGEEVADE